MKKTNIVLSIILVILLSTTTFAEVFSDVPKSAWFYNDIVTLQEKGIITGYLDGTFKPQNSITNAEALKLILSVAGIEPEESNSKDNWISGYINVANTKEIINKSNFKESEKITRLDVAEILVKALEIKDLPITKRSIFKDTDNVSVNILNQLDIIQGVGKPDGVYFNPDLEITRAEISSIILRVDKYMEAKQMESEEPKVEETVTR